MTSGSSQGLFVIVAVVIFGIFVVISYLLFRDKLQTGLASIFDDSIETTKGQAFANPNLIPNSVFNDFSGWFIWGSTELTSTRYKIENNEVLVTKTEFSDIRGGIALDSNSKIPMDINGVYSASIEIFIEDYVGKDGEDSLNSTFFLRTANTEGRAVDFGKVFIGELEKGKWIRLEINGVSPNKNSRLDQSIQFAVGLDGNAKASFRVRKPKLELSKTATAYIP